MKEKSFNQLTRLVHFINGNKIKQLFFPLARGGKSHQHKLYHGIASGDIKKAEDISRHFFSGAKDPGAAGNRLLLELQDSLLDVLFLIDANQSGFNVVQKNYYQCYRNLFANKILAGRFQRSTSIPIAEKTIKKALRFEITDVVVELAKELRFHYGGISGNRSKWKYYQKLLEEWNAKHQAEILIEGYYLDIMCNFILSKSTKKDFSKIVDGYLNSIQTNSKLVKTFRISGYYYMLKVLKYEIINDFENVLKVSKEALVFFDTKKELVTGPMRFTFNKNLLIAYTRLRKFHLAESIAQNCFSLTISGSLNWYNTYYYLIILNFQSGNLKNTLLYWQIVSANNNFKQLPNSHAETWRIIEAVIQFFIAVGKINLNDNQKIADNFRVNRFLNEVPAFSKDKRGNNINILIFHILFLIQGKRYNEIHDRVESLRVYSSRYLRKEDMFRSNCFIRMLICLPAGHFHREAVLRKAKPFLEKLRTVPYEKADQPIEVEIAPYETLWEIVLEMLDPQH